MQRHKELMEETTKLAMQELTIWRNVKIIDGCCLTSKDMFVLNLVAMNRGKNNDEENCSLSKVIQESSL